MLDTDKRREVVTYIVEREKRERGREKRTRGSRAEKRRKEKERRGERKEKRASIHTLTSSGLFRTRSYSRSRTIQEAVGPDEEYRLPW